MFAMETDEPTEKKSYLEQCSTNERMRHIPSLERVRQIVDSEIPATFRKLWVPFSTLPQQDERYGSLENEFRALSRAIDRISEVNRQPRAGGHAPSDPGARIDYALANASVSVAALDPELFGHRLPVQTHERSKAEPLWGSILVVGDHLRRLTAFIRAIDPRIDERLSEGLVVRQLPDEETLKAIA
jgi:hypothetical protein